MTYTYMYFNNYKQISIILQFTIYRKKLFFQKKNQITLKWIIMIEYNPEKVTYCITLIPSHKTITNNFKR